jgi:hypothetical protein
MNGKAATTSYGKKMQPKPGRLSEHKPKISEVHILWITGGLGCDDRYHSRTTKGIFA